MIDRPTLLAVARREQERQVEAYRAKIGAEPDLDRRAHLKRLMRQADYAWAHIALWIEDPRQPPHHADQPAIYGFARRARELALDALRKSDAERRPTNPHLAGLLEIERRIVASIAWANHGGSRTAPAEPERAAA